MKLTLALLFVVTIFGIVGASADNPKQVPRWKQAVLPDPYELKHREFVVALAMSLMIKHVCPRVYNDDDAVSADEYAKSLGIDPKVATLLSLATRLAHAKHIKASHADDPMYQGDFIPEVTSAVDVAALLIEGGYKKDGCVSPMFLGLLQQTQLFRMRRERR